MRKAANSPKLKSSLKKPIGSSGSTPIRFQLDAPPISIAVLVKAARMGMAWAIAMVLFCTLARASACPAVDFKATRALAIAADAEAQYRVGHMYEFGDRVHPDSVQAVIWYRKAAEQGLSRAQYSLARMYAAGDGVEQDYAQAAEWLRKAAAANHPLAANRLGVMCERGEGMSKDYIEAYKWYTLAAKAGHIAGTINRDNLRPRMTTQEIVEGERLANSQRQPPLGCVDPKVNF